MATPEPIKADNAVLEAKALIIDGAVVAQTALPEIKKGEVEVQSKKALKVTVTAYTSDPDETDDTPFHTASGTMTREGVAATNVLPFGTKFKVPKLFGERIFVVEDRMNARYNGVNMVDIWFADKDSALSFGKRSATIEILES